MAELTRELRKTCNRDPQLSPQRQELNATRHPSLSVLDLNHYVQFLELPEHRLLADFA